MTLPSPAAPARAASGSGGLTVARAVQFAEWDAFVAASPVATMSHQAGWRHVMTGVMRHEYHGLEARDASGALRAVLPLVRVRGLVGHFLVSVPFVNDGGPLGEAGACAVLVDYALALARDSAAGLLELRTRHPLDGPLQTSNRKVAVHLPLPDTVDALWAKTFKAKLRSQVRRPTKEGMTSACGPALLDEFYAVFSRNMRDLGTPVLPRRFFQAIQAEFGEQVLFFVVRTAEGRTVAASCCMRRAEEMEVTWASSLREFNHLSPNMLLYSSMMEEAIRRGVRLFNFGRSSPGAATHRFKAQWGGHDVPLPWAFWSRDEAAGTPSADSAKFRLATAMWSRLPLAVANRLGPVLARQLP